MSSPAAEVTTPTRTASRGGSISTEEIKARIEAMFAPAPAPESEGDVGMR